ncbi:MAG: hypothetical protein PS018_17330 [bacterium]|nr:hypothetical protein [bacterium]
MSDIVLDGPNYDRYLTVSEKIAYEDAVASNDAFTIAMTKAIKRGRENVKPGTFVDTTPPIGAKKLRGTLPMSSCGSPSAMCMETGGAHIGAQAMK